MRKIFFILLFCFGLIVLGKPGFADLNGEFSEWYYNTSMPKERAYMGICVLDDILYVAGGYDGKNVVDTFYVHFKDHDLWSSLADLPEPRQYHVLVPLGDSIYLIGGQNNEGTLKTVYAYNPVLNDWSRKADLSTQRHGLCAAVWNGKIYVFGGDSSGNVLKSVEMYDPSSDTWITKKDMPTARLLATASTVGDKIYVAGGFQSAAGSSLDTLEIYDPKTDTWQNGTPMSTPRLGAASVAACGKMVVMGGDTYDETLNSVEIFDPDLGYWTAGPPMVYARRNFDATLLDGNIYAGGGFDNNSAPAVFSWKFEALDIDCTAVNDPDEEPEPDPLTPPENVQLLWNDDVFTLSWSAVSGAEGYRLAMKFSASEQYDASVDLGSVTSLGPFSASILPPGTYYLALIAYQGDRKSPLSQEVVLQITAEPSDLLPPGNLSYTLTGNILTLNWDPVEACDGYLLFFGLVPGNYLPGSVDMGTATQLGPLDISSLAQGRYAIAAKSYLGDHHSPFSNEIILSVGGDDFTPQPTVPGDEHPEIQGPVTLDNVTTHITLEDDSRVEFSGLGEGSSVRLTLERAPEETDMESTQLEMSGSMRTITIENVVYNGSDSHGLFAPVITIPKGDIGTIDPHTVNILRISENPESGEEERHYFTVYTDDHGNLTFKDWILPGEIFQDTESEDGLRAKWTGSIRISYAPVTIQSTDNHAVSAKLARMTPKSINDEKRILFSVRQESSDGPIYATTLQDEREHELRKPVQNVVIFVHGHNEAEKTGYTIADATAPWLYPYKRNVWTQMYDTFSKTYGERQGCTVFYEFIYPSWRPIFQHLNSALANLVKTELAPQLENGMDFNLFIVAHSMGGLVARAGMQLFETELKENLQHFVSWGSPHHGTPLNTFRFAITSPVLESLLPFSMTNIFKWKLSKAVMPTQGVFDLRWTMASLGYNEDLKLDEYFKYTGPATGDIWEKWNLSSGSMLYNQDINMLNHFDDLGDRYTLLYGITDQILKQNIADASTSEWAGAFLNLSDIGVGATFVYMLMGNASSQVMGADLGDSDGASPVISMAGVGITDQNLNIGYVDHEQYFHEHSNALKTAQETFTAMDFSNSVCDCPELIITEPVEGASFNSTQAVTVSGNLVWPGDKAAGRRIAHVVVHEKSIDGLALVSTNVEPLEVNEDGSFTGNLKLSELGLSTGGHELTFSTVLKDNTRVSEDLSVELEEEDDDEEPDYGQRCPMTYHESYLWVDDSPDDEKGQWHQCNYYDNGQLGSESHKRGSGMGLYSGLQLEYYENGQMKYVSTLLYEYADGTPSENLKAQGVAKRWYENGTLELDAFYVDGYPVGEVRKFCEDGNLFELITYSGKAKNGPFENYFCRTDTREYHLREKGEYTDGKWDGPYEVYNVSGELQRKGTWKMGVQVGEWYNGLGDCTFHHEDGSTSDCR